MLGRSLEDDSCLLQASINGGDSFINVPIIEINGGGDSSTTAVGYVANFPDSDNDLIVQLQTVSNGEFDSCYLQVRFRNICQKTRAHLIKYLTVCHHSL